MAGKTWVIVVTVAVLILHDIDTGQAQKKFTNTECSKDNVQITNGGFGIILKDNSDSSNSCKVENTKCIFVFETNSSSIRYGRGIFKFKDLNFWLGKGSEQWYLDVKNLGRKKRDFNITLCETGTGSCSSQLVAPKKICGTEYKSCDGPDGNIFRYRINMNNSGTPRCTKCGNPIPPAPVIDNNKIDAFVDLGITSGNNDSVAQKVDPAKASKVMQALSSVSEVMGNLTLASISIGPVKGVMVKPKNEEDLKKISFISSDSNDGIQLIEDEDKINTYPLAVSVSEEAYRKAFNQNKQETFVGVFRFPNLTGVNTTALNDEVYGIDMGTNISNLSEPIQIKYNNVPPRGFNLSCQSWDGEGDQPNWTDVGCLTNISNHVTCECSHLTFFAILMTPLGQNEPISTSDLTSLTYISYIGCGVSVFFLGVALFMFFCIRKANASNGIHILIHLLLALFLLNISFLTNEWITNLENVVACKVIAAFMHYSMLCSFTWFAVEAFHLCLQLTNYATVSITNYKLKLCCVGWIPGALVVLILFSVGKYGELKISTNNETVGKMCWILDGRLQYGVNIGYYAIVFVFTFTIFVVMLRWLWYLRWSKTKVGAGEKQSSTRTKDVITIMGLCCMLGITWSFAFFSQGPLRIPSYYIFTILNSLQGFFLFLYYYNTSRIIGDGDANSSSSTSTKTSISTEDTKNPYM